MIKYSIGFSTLFFFFFLDEKETKYQDKPDPSGRFVGLSAPGGYLSIGFAKFKKWLIKEVLSKNK